jgi:hypothetical protein
MSNFFDNLCRTLATPMPRKRALQIIAGGIAGAIMAPFAFGQGKKTCSDACTCNGATNGKNNCCSPGQTCYSSGADAICCGPGYVGAFCSNNGKSGGKVQCVVSDATGSVPSNCNAIAVSSICS